MNESPIWRIKYLPKSLDEISGRENIRNRLREIIQNRNFPHLLFIGSEGIGKTTLARLFAKEFLGRYYDANFKLVHADVPLTSEERSQARSDAYVSTSKIGSMAGKRITTPAFIQVKIKPFVQLKVLGDVPFKILIVKNFDALGSNQQGFRRLMEIYGSNCRMILITTKISGIIDPIVSRCQLFLVPQVDFKSFSNLIHKIADEESLKIKDKVIEVLYKISKGKLSRAIDILQVSSSQGNTIDMNTLYENTRKFENELVRSLILLSFKGKFSKAREQARKIVSDYKFSSHELFTELLKVINKLPLSIYARIKLIDMIADADFRAIDGRDDDIQISTLLAKISKYAECM
ncbi:MAG: AAA family ATPase [Candidatus Lokiarchaeota archaeon]|nr:AAA family ATPase [Candidatus Lokiarchaeota archaeon]MBD3201083.1 AAA family ATPase [Candidatus Lokiarchaeota archaeon]